MSCHPLQTVSCMHLRTGEPRIGAGGCWRLIDTRYGSGGYSSCLTIQNRHLQVAIGPLGSPLEYSREPGAVEHLRFSQRSGRSCCPPAMSAVPPHASTLMTRRAVSVFAACLKRAALMMVFRYEGEHGLMKSGNKATTVKFI